jgi:hypothetical protein
LTPSTETKLLEEIRQAVLGGDLQLARTLIDQLPASFQTPQQITEVERLLEWALEVTHVRRAHAAAQLLELSRTAAYQANDPAPATSWSFDG